ncbi:SAM-dependent methyltransferase [Phaeacidiphilus oryzae]|uniref:SAM-dependent methyltransferase n=1 Tax=Phaeacidiphilus oryzae TaxID=348818 RepID=UPI00068F9D4A|nr:SAM-dependent methyltransferase [Phaeacidiphilus oryzae]
MASTRGADGAEEWAPVGRDLRTDLPHTARMYDYYLGGKDNFPADRAAAEKIRALFPDTFTAARANRRFMVRAARYAAEEGITQFLDIGTGIPTSPNLHEVAQGIHPAARIVYVDNDPIVLAHARALLTSTPQGRTTYIDADLRDPETILSSPQLTRTIDPKRPIALFLMAVLHFVPDSDRPHQTVQRLKEMLPSGSMLVLSHSTADFVAPEMLTHRKDTEDAYATGGTSLALRSGEEIMRFLSGLDPVEPGLCPVHEWRSTAPEDLALSRERVPFYAAVARKP